MLRISEVFASEQLRKVFVPKTKLMKIMRTFTNLSVNDEYIVDTSPTRGDKKESDL